MTWHKQHHWPEAEELRAATLWAEGKSASQVSSIILAEFRVIHTRNAVIGMVHRRGWLKHGVNSPRPQGKAHAPAVRSHHKPAPPAVLAEPVLPSLPLPGVVPISLANLADGSCRWPFDEGLYCGALVWRGPYCAAHYALGYAVGKRERTPRYKPTGLSLRMR